MTLFRLVIRSLLFYRKMHLAVVLAAAIATATLTGALLVGDSVNATLRHAFNARLGATGWAIAPPDRFFSEDLSERFERYDISTAPVLRLNGMVTRGDGAVRVNRINVLGVDERFFQLSLKGNAPEGLHDGAALINSALFERLRMQETHDGEVVLRFDKPSSISRNLVLAPFRDNTLSIRIPVAGIADDGHFGRFSLKSNQEAPLNLFVPLNWLQEQINRKAMANLLLISNTSVNISIEKIEQALKNEWRLSDADAELKSITDKGLELSSARVFIDNSIAEAVVLAQPDSISILTYFVNELRVNESFTPYSMVTAADSRGALREIFPDEMKDDEIVINQWLADDLGAKVGDILTIGYYEPGGWQRLKEHYKAFRICSIIPMNSPAADPGLTPHIPGLSDSERCSEWDPSLPIDLELIRDKDETYWDTYRGTPKAFITLAAGQAMWANSYGALTGVRFQGDSSYKEEIERMITQSVDPKTFGLSVMDVYDAGIKASSGGTDFGQLFLGLSMFLIASGIILTWLLFSFSIESRSGQTGMLLATGFPVERIKRIYLYEGLFIAGAGSLAGAALSLFYTWLVIYGLSTAWQGAVAGMTLLFSPTIFSLVTGFLAGFIIALVSISWRLSRQIKSGAHGLMAYHKADGAERRPRAKAGWLLFTLTLLAGVILIISGLSGEGDMATAIFFIAGILMLVSAMILIWRFMVMAGKGTEPFNISLHSLSLRNSTRRAGRSMAVIIMLACGLFMVVSVSANRKDSYSGAELRGSGTGGFTLYAESSVAVVNDLDTLSGREIWGLNERIIEGARFVSIRLLEGDDASCLNLNRVERPRLLGILPEALAERGAFTFQGLEDEGLRSRPWDIIKYNPGERVIPAVGDYPTVYWGLGKRIGDILIYRNGNGEEVTIRIAGMIKGSILQGGLVISEQAMSHLFPEAEGYRGWLIDAPHDKRDEISAHLTNRMADAGLSVETAIERLRLFDLMEDTYLNIFLMLGGLGLILGCAGLGLIVVRNLLERKGELAMLRAVGFNNKKLFILICYEHGYLLGAGLISGFICAVISVIPVLKAAAGQLPASLLILVAILTGLSGVIWVATASGIALKGDILTPLRNE